MPRLFDVPGVREVLRTRADLARNGHRDRDISRALEGDRLVRIRRGWYMDAATWADLWPEGRHLALVLACANESEGGVHPFSHESAAALHGLPLYRGAPARAHVTMTGSTVASGSVVLTRHTDALPDDDVTVVDGIRCTSEERTVFDLMRLASAENAVSVADASAARAAGVRRDYRPALAEAWRERMRERGGKRGVRGVRQARWMTEFADARADRPLESVSRLQLHRLGFPQPRLQVPVPGPAGETYWIDFGLDAHEAWAEVDGETKYRDEALRAGRTLEDVLLAEKRREDWIRGVTGRRFVRWGSREVASPEALAHRLSSFGIRPPR